MKKTKMFTMLALIVGFFAAVVFYVASDSDLLNQLLKTEENRKEIVQIVRQGMLDGEDEITVKYIGGRKELRSITMEAVEKALSQDDPSTSDDFDYLKHKYRGYTAVIKGFAFYAEITYRFTFSETKMQTDWVDKTVKKIIQDFHFENKSTYEKIKMIHDYIIKNTSYDITVQNNSAYEGLHCKATACEGYANLAYKMFTEAGIGARVITGTADGEAHAWNIVELGGVWYNIDCTWDDPLGGESNNSYNYFLKSSYDFADHIRDEEFDTDDFYLKYPMAKESWKRK